MGAALELFVLPVLLITAIVLMSLETSFSAASVLASAVVLGLLYFVVIKLLRQLERSDIKEEDEERATIKRLEKTAREAHQE